MERELVYWIVFLGFVLVSQAETPGTVYFVETTRENYLRTSPASPAQEVVFDEADIAASVSVLLGVDPPSTLSLASASKLEQLLTPDPFHRPRKVVSLVIEGLDSGYLEQRNATQALGVASAERRALRMKSSKKPAKHLGGKLVVLESLNYPVPDTFGLDDLRRELHEVFDVSVFQEDAEHQIIIISAGGISLDLDLFKREDYLFAVDLVSLVGGVRRTLAEHGKTSDTSNAAELFLGTFSGIKALKQDREDDVVKASNFVLLVVSKLLQTLGTATDGKLVGVVAFPSTGGHHVVRELVGKHYHARRSRLLEKEKKPQTVEVLARRTLVASTSIILIIATLLGTCCLCYMPLTRDSLLYAGLKLD